VPSEGAWSRVGSPFCMRSARQLLRKLYRRPYGLLHKSVTTIQTACSYLVFHLQNAIFLEWAMLGSNQRPLPCEGFPYCPMRLSSLLLPTLILSLP
jgi:hypothetical protein